MVISIESLVINSTEIFVLKIISTYPAIDVPQSIFKKFENSTVKKALRSLKDKGLIYKKYNLEDMRQRYVCLTEYGLEKIEKNEINIR